MDSREALKIQRSLLFIRQARSVSVVYHGSGINQQLAELFSQRLHPLSWAEDMARDSMTIRSKFQSWLHLIADLFSIRAARVKATARGRINRAGHISLENDSFLLMVWIGHRHCGEKRAGIRVFGVAVDRLTRRDFYDLAEIHDRYPVADMLNHSEIVRDEEIGELHLLLKLLEQIDNLGLNGDIQGRDGFVRDDKPGTHG